MAASYRYALEATRKLAPHERAALAIELALGLQQSFGLEPGTASTATSSLADAQLEELLAAELAVLEAEAARRRCDPAYRAAREAENDLLVASWLADLS